MKKGAPTKECLSDFFRRFGKSETFRKLARVSPQTTRRWESGESELIGENLLRVRYFLEMCGYEVAELAVLKPLIFETGQAIAVECTTLDEVAKVLKITEGDHQQILRYLRGEVEPSPERTSALEQLVAEKRDALAQKLAEIRQTLRGEKLLLEGNGKTDLIGNFEEQCTETLRIAKILQEGPLELRAAMRRKMASGSKPLLHELWEALNLLIREQTQPK